MEHFAPILGFPAYLVSSCGRVISSKTGRQVNPQRSPSGRMYVTLYRYSKGHNKYLNTLVIDAFAYNPRGLTRIRHVNGDKHDCHVSNLELLEWTQDDFEDEDPRALYCDD